MKKYWFLLATQVISSVSLLTLSACNTLSTPSIQATPTPLLELPTQTARVLPANTETSQANSLPSSTPAGALLPNTEPYITTTLDFTNLRGGPGISFAVLETAPPAKNFPVLGKQGDWWQIQLSANQTGWVYMHIVKLSGDPETIETVASPPTPSYP